MSNLNQHPGGAHLSVIGGGRVGQTLAKLLHDTAKIPLRDVLCRNPAHAQQAADFIGSGTACSNYASLRPAHLWLIGVPDSAIADAAEQLAQCAVQQGWEPATAFHCSGLCASDRLQPLRALGWTVASVHPALNFANPHEAVRQFAGTLCGIEGDPAACDWLHRAMTIVGGQPFALQAQTKLLYHAAAVFCSNFTIALQDIAQQAWRTAGLAPEVIAPLNQQLLEVSVRNALALGPSHAITGPAARADAQVVREQQAAVAQWNPAAGQLYQQLSEAAYHLAQHHDALHPRGAGWPPAQPLALSPSTTSAPSRP